MKFFIAFIFLGASFGTLALENKIAHSLKGKTSSDILISFGSIPSSIYKNSGKSFETRTSRIYGLVEGLQQHSKNIQAPLLNYLSLNGAQFKQLWVTNQISVKDASAELIKQIATYPEITEIIEDILIPLVDDEVPKPKITGRTKALNEWGIERIRAPEALALLQEQVRSTVRVAIIDTGIRASHEALRSSFSELYGWLDPIDGYVDPRDDNGHGTHVAGTIAGDNGIGVYPDAIISACKGCGESCPSSALIECGQWALCPYLADGTNANCSYAANIVSNSWNGGQGATWYNPVIEAWHRAGIIPIFSAGNAGPACSTIQSPADGNVISVGATTNTDSIIYFSSTGPSVFGDIKPDLAAPGYDIVSAWPTGDSAYASASGTSMACPHTSGLVAILLSYKPDLTFEQVKKFLTSNAERNLVESGRTCGNVTGKEWPNNDFGFGRISAVDSLASVIASYPVLPSTTTTTEKPITTTQEPITTQKPTTTEEEITTPAPIGGCYHGPFWYPDSVNVPNLICVCQATVQSGLAYTCLTAVSS